MTEYWNGGITGVSMNRGKSFLGLSGWLGLLWWRKTHLGSGSRRIK